MSRRSAHWAQINEATFAGGMRLLFMVYRKLGRWPFRIALYPVIAWYVLSKPAARRASAAFLQRAGQADQAGKPGNTGQADRRRRIPFGWLGVMRHFASFGESILDKMMVWAGLFPMDSVRQFGHERLEAELQAGRGALLICTHLGNLELCRVVSLRCTRLKMTVLVHTRHAAAFNRLLAQLSPESTLNLMQVTEMSPATAIELSTRVAYGEFVVIAGDRIPVSPSPRVTVAPFLGRAASFPVGPYVLASLLQCPVYLMFSRRTRDGAELSFEPFRERISLPRKAREQAFAALAADYAQRLQFHCLRDPLQWFNFYDFWQLPEADADLPKVSDESN